MSRNTWSKLHYTIALIRRIHTSGEIQAHQKNVQQDDERRILLWRQQPAPEESVPDLTSAFPNNKKVAASKSWMLVDAKANQCCWKWSSMTSCIMPVSMLMTLAFWIPSYHIHQQFSGRSQPLCWILRWDYCLFLSCSPLICRQASRLSIPPIFSREQGIKDCKGKG